VEEEGMVRWSHSWSWEIRQDPMQIFSFPSSALPCFYFIFIFIKKVLCTPENYIYLEFCFGILKNLFGIKKYYKNKRNARKHKN